MYLHGWINATGELRQKEIVEKVKTTEIVHESRMRAWREKKVNRGERAGYSNGGLKMTKYTIDMCLS